MTGLRAAGAAAVAVLGLLVGSFGPPIPFGQEGGQPTSATDPKRQGAGHGDVFALPGPAKRPDHSAGAQQPSQLPVDCRKVKCVAITFDDGPVGNTATVLDVLRSRSARATFFVLGAQARKHPGLLRRMVAEGHTVGNHSWNHPILFGLKPAAIRKQFARTEKVITAAIGKHQVLIRTPFGQQNKRIRTLVGDLGSPVILWDVDPRDWKDRNTVTVTKRVVKATRRNSIVLLHDVWPTSRAAVAGILDKLQAKGYVMVTVPELIGSHLRAGKVYLHR